MTLKNRLEPWKCAFILKVSLWACISSSVSGKNTTQASSQEMLCVNNYFFNTEDSPQGLLYSGSTLSLFSYNTKQSLPHACRLKVKIILYYFPQWLCQFHFSMKHIFTRTEFKNSVIFLSRKDALRNANVDNIKQKCYLFCSEKDTDICSNNHSPNTWGSKRINIFQ